MSDFSLVDRIRVGNVLGESILWDERARCVWWTDIQGRQLYRYQPSDSELQRFAVPERLASFGMVADGEHLVCAFESGIALFEPQTGNVRWLYRPEANFSGTRFNDGRVDRSGRFWAGTMVEGGAFDADGQPAKASLYRVSDNAQERLFGGVEISNSICFSLDGVTMYFADSPGGKILAFDLDPETASVGESRIFAEMQGPGVPDGSIVDAEGYLWNAQWGGSKIVRYTPQGEPAAELELPVSQPTCLCFGGEDLDYIYVSTATENLDADTLNREPDAGNVLVYRTVFKGVPESRFRTDSKT